MSDKLIDMMRDVSRDLAMRAVMECGKQYNFSGEEAIRMLGLGEVNVKTTKGKSLVVKEKPAKAAKAAKASFPLPFSGVMNEMCCHGLKSNHGLYTQCVSSKGEGSYCNSCEMQASKNANGKPDCGDIEDRLAVGLYEFKDSKAKSPVAYTKIMKKLNLSKEDVMSEARKMNVSIPEEHFEVNMGETKRGRPKSDKVEKEPKGAKGRPKKTKKVLELIGDEEDLFSALVARANTSEVEEVVEIVNTPKDNDVKEAAKEAAKAAKEAEKVAVKAAEKAAKEAAKAAEKAAEKAAKEAAKEAEKVAAKAAKEAEKAAAKAAKEAEKVAAKAASKSNNVSKPVEAVAVEAVAVEAVAVEAVAVKEKESVPKVVVEDNEPDVVKKFEYEGKKYLKSKKTGIIYNMEQDVVGKWNNETNKIDFMDMEDEECESEYDE